MITAPCRWIVLHFNPDRIFLLLFDGFPLNFSGNKDPKITNLILKVTDDESDVDLYGSDVRVRDKLYKVGSPPAGRRFNSSDDLVYDPISAKLMQSKHSFNSVSAVKPHPQLTRLTINPA